MAYALSIVINAYSMSQPWIVLADMATAENKLGRVIRWLNEHEVRYHVEWEVAPQRRYIVTYRFVIYNNDDAVLLRLSLQ